MCRMLFSGQSLILKELKVAVKIWCLGMSGNKALGGGCNEPKRAADFHGLLGIFPLAALSLLHSRAIALNFPHCLIRAVLQQVSRGCVQSQRGFGFGQGQSSWQRGNGKASVTFPFTSHPKNLRINASIVDLNFPSG